MDKRLFDSNPLFGITRYSYYDEDKDLFHIETVQDIEPIVEHNRAQRVETDKHTPWGNDGATKVATIPLNILEKLMADGILVVGKNGDGEGNRRLKAWLNDRDNEVFRTREGRV